MHRLPTLSGMLSGGSDPLLKLQPAHSADSSSAGSLTGHVLPAAAAAAAARSAVPYVGVGHRVTRPGGDSFINLPTLYESDKSGLLLQLQPQEGETAAAAVPAAAAAAVPAAAAAAAGSNAAEDGDVMLKPCIGDHNSPFFVVSNSGDQERATAAAAASAAEAAVGSALGRNIQQQGTAAPEGDAAAGTTPGLPSGLRWQRQQQQQQQQMPLDEELYAGFDDASSSGSLSSVDTDDGDAAVRALKRSSSSQNARSKSSSVMTGQRATSRLKSFLHRSRSVKQPGNVTDHSNAPRLRSVGSESDAMTVPGSDVIDAIQPSKPPVEQPLKVDVCSAADDVRDLGPFAAGPGAAAAARCIDVEMSLLSQQQQHRKRRMSAGMQGLLANLKNKDEVLKAPAAAAAVTSNSSGSSKVLPPRVQQQQQLHYHQQVQHRRAFAAGGGGHGNILYAGQDQLVPPAAAGAGSSTRVQLQQQNPAYLRQVTASWTAGAGGANFASRGPRGPSFSIVKRISSGFESDQQQQQPLLRQVNSVDAVQPFGVAPAAAAAAAAAAVAASKSSSLLELPQRSQYREQAVPHKQLRIASASKDGQRSAAAAAASGCSSSVEVPSSNTPTEAALHGALQQQQQQQQRQQQRVFRRNSRSDASSVSPPGGLATTLSGSAMAPSPGQLQYSPGGTPVASATSGGLLLSGSAAAGGGVEALTGALPLEALPALRLNKLNKHQSFMIQAIHDQVR